MVYSRNTVVPEEQFLTSEIGDQRGGSAIGTDGMTQFDAPRIEREHDPVRFEIFIFIFQYEFVFLCQYRQTLIFFIILLSETS